MSFFIYFHNLLANYESSFLPELLHIVLQAIILSASASYLTQLFWSLKANSFV